MSAPAPGGIPLLVLALLAAAAPAQKPLAAKDPALSGAHVEVTVHGADERLLPRAVAAADAAWPIVATLFGRANARPAKPLQVHLYGTAAGYVAAEKKLTQGKFARNLAMFHHGSRSAHVALQPPCSDEALRAFDLPGQTIVLLAWEATHAARAEICANFVAHPDWFVDGLAAWVASQVLEGIHGNGSADAAPLFSTHTDRAQVLQRDRKLPPVLAILADRIDELDLPDRYAVRAVLFRFLASGVNAAKLATIASAVRTTGAGADHGKKVAAAVTKALGGGLQADFERFVADARPVWSEVFRSLWTAGPTWQQAAFVEKNALAWRCEPVRGGIVASGGLRILPGGTQQLNFLFARGDGGFYSVAFVADRGFTVFDYAARKDAWQQLGAGNAPQLRLGVRAQFAVEAVAGKLTVRLDDQSWTFDLPRPLPDEIVWGVGAQSGSAGTWHDVKVIPPK